MTKTTITLVTTQGTAPEVGRIRKEVEALGYKFKLLDLDYFSFFIQNGALRAESFEIPNGVVMVRGVLHSIKVIAVILESLKKTGVKVFDNNFLEHRYSIDKVTDLAKLVQKGLPVPDTYWARTFARYPGFAKKLEYPLVVKSARMGRGAGVFKIDEQKGLLKLVSEFEEEEKKTKSWLLQKFIPYQYDLRILIIGERVFTMRRIPAKGEFRANFSLGGRVELFRLDEEGQKLAVGALEAIGMSVGGVDMLITAENKRFILEVNHSPGFAGMEKATGENIARAYVKHAIKNAK